MRFLLTKDSVEFSLKKFIPYWIFYKVILANRVAKIILLYRILSK
jgi:hypothetical protein